MRADDTPNAPSSEMLRALLRGEALEHRVWAGAAGTRRAVELTTFEGGRCGSSATASRTGPPLRLVSALCSKYARNRASIPARFASSSRAQSDLGPAIDDAAGQVARPRSLETAQDVSAPSRLAASGAVADRPWAGVVDVMRTSLNLMYARPIRTWGVAGRDLGLF